MSAAVSSRLLDIRPQEGHEAACRRVMMPVRRALLESLDAAFGRKLRRRNIGFSYGGGGICFDRWNAGVDLSIAWYSSQAQIMRVTLLDAEFSLLPSEVVTATPWIVRHALAAAADSKGFRGWDVAQPWPVPVESWYLNDYRYSWSVAAGAQHGAWEKAQRVGREQVAARLALRDHVRELASRLPAGVNVNTDPAWRRVALVKDLGRLEPWLTVDQLGQVVAVAASLKAGAP